MNTDSARCAGELALDVRPSRRWQDVVLVAQQDLAAALAGAVADGRLNRQTYQHWLATESAVCRINALALDAVADWHVSQPHLRAAVHAWATTMRDDALVAAADVRAIDGMTAATPPPLVPWQAFLESTSRSSRAGEALGAVVLHAGLMRGPMHKAITAMLALPFVSPRCGGYLLQRRQSDLAAIHDARQALLDAYAAAALATGAQRAADWHRAALESVLGHGHHRTGRGP